MQALYERAYGMGKVSAEDRQRFYRQMSKRGWRAREPGADRLRLEAPVVAAAVGSKLKDAGLTINEIRTLVGVQSDVDNPFLPPQPSRGGLQVV